MHPEPHAGGGQHWQDRVLHRPVCDLLGCRLPLVLAGMGGVARAELALAVARAGGFGFLGMVREPVALIREQVAQMRDGGAVRFGVNLIPSATDPALLAAQVDACIDLKVPVLGLFWDVLPALVRRLADAGIVVLHQVGSVADAREAEAAGARVLVVQGVEAGGHVRAAQPLLQLLPEVLAAVQVPVLAAGGLAGGADVATVLALGAQGAMLGTALMATHESFAHDHHKRRLVQADASQAVLTEAFHINWPRGAKVRVLASAVTRGERGDPFAGGAPVVVGHDAGRPIYLFSTDSPLRTTTGELESMALYAGRGVGRLQDVPAAGERLRRIALDAAQMLRTAASEPPPVELSSPVCFAREFELTRADAIERPALLAALAELLEGARAAVRLGLLHSDAGADDADAAHGSSTGEQLAALHRDELKWCGMLVAAIHSLGATPSTRTGAFFEQAAAIGEPRERLAAMLRRRREQAAPRLRALLPGVVDEPLSDGLAEMLAAYRNA